MAEKGCESCLKRVIELLREEIATISLARRFAMHVQPFVLSLLTWFLVALTPGPAVICVMSQAARHGLQAGFRGIVGIQIGNLIFFVCIAFGLVTLLATMTNAFVILQIAGAAYLLFLGVRIIISSLQRTSAETVPTRAPGEKTGNLVVQALLVQLTNPKALMFVSALLPQFLDPERQMMLQMAILLTCTVALDTIVLGSYVLLADRGAHLLRQTRLAKGMECTFGVALIGLGVGLLHWRK